MTASLRFYGIFFTVYCNYDAATIKLGEIDCNNWISDVLSSDFKEQRK